MHTVWSTDRSTTSGDSDSFLILVKEGRAYDINTQMKITELQSDQEESDSRVVLHCMYAAEKGNHMLESRHRTATYCGY